MELNLNFHDKQVMVWNAPEQFVVLSAGRRSGKSHLAAGRLIEQVCLTSVHGRELTTNNVVFYGAPSRDQARRMIWAPLKEITSTAKKYFTFKEKDLIVTFEPTGRQILCMGLDNPDAPRGSSLSYAILDEFPLIKPEAWELSVGPALTDCDGGAMFIGTPDPNSIHFEKMWKEAKAGHLGSEWGAYNFGSVDNPWGPKASVIEKRRQTMTADAFQREFLGKFADATEGAFPSSILPPIDPEGARGEGRIYTAIDLMGFTDEDVKTTAQLKRRDESVICTAKVGVRGWHVLDMQHGRWDVRETANRIVNTYRQYNPVALGIEQGTTKNAVGPYLKDYQRQYGVNFEVTPLRHGNKAKASRILWALQGRFQKGRITFAEGPWNQVFWEQARRFPSRQAHDDLLDALSYIDQISQTTYRQVGASSYLDDDCLDDEAGY